jgi:PAS domain S-box-containing protein
MAGRATAENACTMSPETDTIRVLHVDDDAAFADLAATFIEREDERFSVEVATSAEEGLDRLEAGTYDCVVSDYEMPEGDGIEFLETVRAERPDLPFLLFTGKGSEEIASEAISAGVSDYLQKGAGSEQYELLANRITNVVEAHRSRRLLRERTRRLETLISNLPGMVYRCRNDRTWRMETVEGEVRELTGYAADQLETNAVSWGEEVLHPEDRDRMWEAVQGQLDGDDYFEVTYRIVTDGGETRWMWERGRAVETERGEPELLEGFITDITERKRRQRELERTSDLLDTTERIADVGGWEIDPETRDMYWTENLYELLGVDRDVEPSLAASLERYHEEDRPMVESAIESATESAEPFDVEARARRSDGEHRWLRVKGEPATENGDLASVRGAIRDITDAKERERELRRQNERLEGFASVVSHDLRNPLSVADGRLELAREECDSDHLHRIDDALERMDRIVEDVLRIARGRDDVGETEPIDLRRAVEDAWELPADGVPDAELVVSDGGAGTIDADGERLRHLLENLFDNAIEHAGPDVTVRVGTLEDGFFVADDGPGIPEDAREDVFEEGYSTAESGTGFGLNIVEQVADGHGWSIAATDAATGGARFEITGVETPD